jgi:type I restriction enzyme S subunit
VSFALPPVPEQRKIAAILSAVDEVIEKTEAVIESLQTLKKAMMQELLTRGLPGCHSRFKHTEIGEIPDEWKVVRVEDIAPTDRPCAQTGPFGQQLGPDDFQNDGVPVIKIGNVRWGYVDLTDLDYVSEQKALELARFRVREGDLLFARQGATTGRNALADSRCDGFLINYHIIRVAVDAARCDPRFLSACFNSDLVQRQVGQNKQRGNRDGINTHQILGFQFPLPPISTQRRIADALEHVTGAADTHHHELVALRSTKSALMSVLITGELRVASDENAA